MTATTNTAPGYAGHSGARDEDAFLRLIEVCRIADELNEQNRKRHLLEGAAPDMYEALRQIGFRYGPTRDLEECAELARAAIAKAEGREVVGGAGFEPATSSV